LEPRHIRHSGNKPLSNSDTPAPARFWQCQPPGYTAPPEGRAKLSIAVTQRLPGVPASAIDTGALATGFQFELNQKLAAEGLSAQVGVQASDLLPSGGRRLRQAGGATSQLKYTIGIMVPAGEDPASVSAATRTGAPGKPSAGSQHPTPCCEPAPTTPVRARRSATLPVPLPRRSPPIGRSCAGSCSAACPPTCSPAWTSRP
jgi:hypothetical protein